MNKQGKINVETQTFLPNKLNPVSLFHELMQIFLRELVLNYFDSSQKIVDLKTVGELNSDISKLKVEVILDKKSKTLTIRDNGIVQYF